MNLLACHGFNYSKSDVLFNGSEDRKCILGASLFFLLVVDTFNAILFKGKEAGAVGELWYLTMVL